MINSIKSEKFFINFLINFLEKSKHNIKKINQISNYLIRN